MSAQPELKRITSAPRDVPERTEALDWKRILHALDERGSAVVERFLSAHECRTLVELYPDQTRFRSRVVMERHGFGRGEYKYFGHPLPTMFSELRSALYARLVPTANSWNSMMRIDESYPATHADFLAKCHAAGQMKPTPLLLKYGPGDYNCLHQDLYGAQVFPLQVAILLSRPEVDFTGGEFVITEQRPRMQSRPEVIRLQQGDAVIFAVRNRPVRGKRGAYRVNLRHGVSRIHTGERYAAGVIFHDAE